MNDRTRWLSVPLAIVCLGPAGCGGSVVDDGMPGGGGPTVVRMVTSRGVYDTGQRMVIQVVIQNGQNVGSVPFHLRYNPQVVDFIEPPTEGPFLGADGAMTVFLAADPSGGEIVVGLSRFDPVGMSGSGLLAEFAFDAIAAGDCGFGFSAASVKDPEAADLPAAFDPTSVRVE
ncbi:MAG TPA: cohesin domain-containing protein [Candidatus Polarisedimenticolaceae bacterium]|nr:cohesin domain-containing protein [Candidatus Polarisedimenticolaceae bacterium]